MLPHVPMHPGRRAPPETMCAWTPPGMRARGIMGAATTKLSTALLSKSKGAGGRVAGEGRRMIEQDVEGQEGSKWRIGKRGGAHGF